MFKVFLTLHILAGTVGLIIGPIAMYSQKRKGLHTKAGLIYFYLMAFVCASATVLGVLHWETSWWLILVAAFSFSNAWFGYRASRVRGAGWKQTHISGMLGSYIAMTTALLVTNISRLPGSETVPGIIYWILPTIIGTPLIARVKQRHQRPNP